MKWKLLLNKILLNKCQNFQDQSHPASLHLQVYEKEDRHMVAISGGSMEAEGQQYDEEQMKFRNILFQNHKKCPQIITYCVKVKQKSNPSKEWQKSSRKFIPAPLCLLIPMRQAAFLYYDPLSGFSTVIDRPNKSGISFLEQNLWNHELK